MRLAIMLAAALAAAPLHAEEVGSWSNDWTGNGLIVDAIADPKVDGVTCHIVRFDRSLIDRVSKGNWFEEPSNAGIACSQTGPIVIGAIEKGSSGEDVFSERTSLVFKSLRVRRIWDEKNESLVYVTYSRQVTDASAKVDISSIPLRGQTVSWAD